MRREEIAIGRDLTLARDPGARGSITKSPSSPASVRAPHEDSMRVGKPAGTQPFVPVGNPAVAVLLRARLHDVGSSLPSR